MSQSPPHSPLPETGVFTAWWADFRTALAFLTRLPLPADGGVLPRAARTFPLVGLVVGLIGWLAYAVAGWLSLPGPLAATLAVAATILVTGAMHEDGLADTVDGFGGADRDAKLAIMRDSRTGNFGALALILSVLLRVLAVALLAEPRAGSLVAGALIAVHAVSRAVLPAVMHSEALARETGFAVAAGRPDRPTVYWSLGIGALVALLALGLGTAILALVVAAAAAAAVAWLARRQIGGYTGDVLGAVQQAAETAMLLAIVALW